jgi:hypothetical protein
MKLATLLLPQRCIVVNCSSVHASRATERTKLMCVPNERCIAAQSTQMNVP